jgi:uncharacterized phiE125 gp8 family phage protein
MLEAQLIVVRPEPLFTDAELLTMCDAYDGQLTECQTALAGSTQWIEQWTHRSLLTQKRQATFSAWPTFGLELGHGPVSSIDSVTVRVSEVDTVFVAGTDYRFASSLSPARLIILTDAPAIDAAEDAITVIYNTGVAARGDVDGVLVSAVERFTKHLFEHPGDTEGDFCRALKNYLRPMRVSNISGV